MIPSDLKAAIESKDTNKVKAIILLQINSDRSKKNLLPLILANHADKELAKLGVALYQEDDGGSHYLDNRSQWNKDLWGNLRIDFEYNFSRKKLEQIIEVMEYLRKEGDLYFQIDETLNDGRGVSSQSISKDSSKQTSSLSAQSSKNLNYMVGAVAGAVVGAVGGKALGFCVGEKALGFCVGGVVIGVAIGLATVYFKDKKD